MANITTTTAAAFIPEVWANRALEVLRANHPGFNRGAGQTPARQ